MMDGAELRRSRECLELSVDQLAAELDVPAELLRRWEEGRARIPRRRVEEIPRQLAALERERERRRNRRAAGPRKTRTSRLIWLVPVLLLVASVIGYLPASDAWGVLLYPLSLFVGGVLGVDVYRGLPWLRNAGVVGRFMANWAAASAAMVGFLGTFLVSGYSSTVTEAQPLSFIAAVLIGVGTGVLYAIFRALTEMIDDSR